MSNETTRLVCIRLGALLRSTADHLGIDELELYRRDGGFPANASRSRFYRALSGKAHFSTVEANAICEWLARIWGFGAATPFIDAMHGRPSPLDDAVSAKYYRDSASGTAALQTELAEAVHASRRVLVDCREVAPFLGHCAWRRCLQHACASSRHAASLHAVIGRLIAPLRSPSARRTVIRLSRAAVSRFADGVGAFAMWPLDRRDVLFEEMMTTWPLYRGTRTRLADDALVLPDQAAVRIATDSQTFCYWPTARVWRSNRNIEGLSKASVGGIFEAAPGDFNPVLSPLFEYLSPRSFLRRRLG